MNHKRLLPQIAGLTLIWVLLVACGTPYTWPDGQVKDSPGAQVINYPVD